jgi:hypothetical protein
MNRWTGPKPGMPLANRSAYPRDEFPFPERGRCPVGDTAARELERGRQSFKILGEPRLARAAPNQWGHFIEASSGL